MRKFRRARERLFDVVDTIVTGLGFLGLLLGSLISLAFVLTLLFSKFPGPVPIPEVPDAAYIDLVTDGDLAFREYRYDDAQKLYGRAQNALSALIQFESESPSKDLSLLQHYHNSQTFLKTRIELVVISQEISRLQARTNR